jgi:hypothetical protein
MDCMYAYRYFIENATYLINQNKLCCSSSKHCSEQQLAEQGDQNQTFAFHRCKMGSGTTSTGLRVAFVHPDLGLGGALKSCVIKIEGFVVTIAHRLSETYLS